MFPACGYSLVFTIQLVDCFRAKASDQMQPLMFNEDGTQKDVTLSASTVHSGYDVAWVSIHAAHYPQWHLPFDMGTHDAYQWFQVRNIMDAIFAFTLLSVNYLLYAHC